MAPGWQEIASQHVEQITGNVREILSYGLVFLKSELGIDLGLNPDLCAPWVLLLTAWIGLVLLLVLWVSVCRGVSRRLTETPDTGIEPPTKKPDNKADEPKKKNRRKNAEKKAQKNGLAVEPQEDPKVLDTTGPPEMKADKAKKNKKKQKAPVKEKSSASGDGKEPDEGTWETKVSNREKRQKKRKDKTPGDGSASPEPTETSSAIITMEQVQTAPDEPETNIKTTASTPVVQREVEEKPPKVEANYVRDTVVPQVTPCWEEVLSVNGSGWSDLSLKLPPQISSVQAESWTSRTAEPSVWPQDMEGSWTIVDGSQIPVSFSGISGVPDLSWAPQPPPVKVDDEWSGLNSASADPSCDWSAPSEEWGNYVAQQPVSAAPLEQPIPEVPRVSEVEKEKDEAAPPGSGKAKKKKKKKKADDAGPSAQIPPQVKAERDPSAGPQTQSTAGNPLAATAGTRVEVPAHAVPSVPVQTQQKIGGPESTDKPAPVPTQKKPEESFESPKQVKKKKARRDI